MTRFNGKEVFYEVDQNEIFIRLTHKDLPLLFDDRNRFNAFDDHPGGVFHVIGVRLLREGIEQGRFVRLGRL
jgi:hypothetical protein